MIDFVFKTYFGGATLVLLGILNIKIFWDLKNDSKYIINFVNSIGVTILLVAMGIVVILNKIIPNFFFNY